MLTPRNNRNQPVTENQNVEDNNQPLNQEAVNQNQVNNRDGLRVTNQSRENQETRNIFSRLRNGVRNLRDTLTSRFRDGYNNARNSSNRNEQRRSQQVGNAQENLYDPNYDFEAAVSNPSTDNRRDVNLRNEAVGGGDAPPPVRRNTGATENVNNEREATTALMEQLAEARRDAPGGDPNRARGMIGRLRERWDNMNNIERASYVGLILLALGLAANAAPILIAHTVGHMPWLGGAGESAAAIKATLGTGSIANVFGNGAWGTFNWLAANGYPTINMLGSGAKAISAWHGVGWASASTAALIASFRLGRDNRRFQNQIQPLINNENTNPPSVNPQVNNLPNFGVNPFEYASRNANEEVVAPISEGESQTTPPVSVRPKRFRARRGVSLERDDLQRSLGIGSPTLPRTQEVPDIPAPAEPSSTNLGRSANVYSFGRENIIQDGLLQPNSRVSEVPQRYEQTHVNNSVTTNPESSSQTSSAQQRNTTRPQTQTAESDQRSTTATATQEQPRTETEQTQQEAPTRVESQTERERNFNIFINDLNDFRTFLHENNIFSNASARSLLVLLDEVENGSNLHDFLANVANDTRDSELRGEVRIRMRRLFDNYRNFADL
jgi:hypothetical protein